MASRVKPAAPAGVRINAKNQLSLATGGDQAGRAADFIDSIDPKQTFGRVVRSVSHAMRSSRLAIEKGLFVRAVPEVLQSKLYTGAGRWVPTPP